MSVIALIFLYCSITALIIFFLAIFAFEQHVSPKIQGGSGIVCPPVSIIKPIKGLEEDLESNLQTFFLQNYQSGFEIIFSSSDTNDPGIAIAKKVARENPLVCTQFLVSDPDIGLNPKIANLTVAFAAARYDLVWQTDANVRVEVDYLSKVTRELIENNSSVLTSIVAGVGEISAGAAMTNLHLSAYLAPAMCLALVFGKTPCVFGKSILFRRSEFQKIGGLYMLRNVLAEDFLLGAYYKAAGKSVLISRQCIVQNVNISTTMRDFSRRQARWLILRAVIHKPAFIMDLLANPVPFAILSLAFSPLRLVVVPMLVILLKLLLDNYMLFRVRGAPLQARFQLLIPIKDSLMWIIWGYSSLARTVNWRGRELKIGHKSALLAGISGRLEKRIRKYSLSRPE